jgi:hypothetical protein
VNIKGPSIFLAPSVGGPPYLAPGCAYRRAAAMGILPRARVPSYTHGGLKPGAALVGAQLS